MIKLILIMFIIFPLQIFSQTLADAVASALEYNNQTKAAKRLTHSAEEEKLSEQRSHFPSVSVKANYVHITDVPEFDIPIPNFNRKIMLNPHDSYETGIHVDYIIFSGFAQSQAAKVKEFEHSVMQVKEDQQMKDVAFNTVQAYRNAQLLKLSLDIINDTRQRNIIQMNRAKALLENGMALQLDTLSLSLNRMTIEQQIIQSQSVLKNWFQILEMLTGKKLTLADVNELSDNPFFNNFSSDEQNALKNVKLEKQKMSAFKTISKSGYYPKVWLNASFNYGKPGLDVIKNEWSTYGKWMVGLQWEIWNWWSDNASVQAKDLKLQALQFSEKALQDQLKLDYDKAFRSFEALQKQNKVAQQAVKVAREKMQIVDISAQKGQLSVSDFNEANLELSQVEIRLKQILIQLNLQATKIDFLSGKPVKMWRF